MKEALQGTQACLHVYNTLNIDHKFIARALQGCSEFKQGLLEGTWNNLATKK
jgi:hypothetical protein